MMKALSIIQPWASLIMFGGKDIENRTWLPPADLFGQRIAIHASAKRTREVIEEAEDWALILKRRGKTWSAPPLEAYGSVLGTVTLAGWCTKCTGNASQWFEGPYGLLLLDPRPFERPVPAKGKLGFWEWEA